jgi:glutathione S-transferase
MPFTLYNAPQSTCSQRVRFVLNGKALPFDEVKLDLLAGDQLKPDYLKLNPNGVVPTLDHDGSIVIDSSVIIEYLDEVEPGEENFTPKQPVARARMRALMRFIDEMPLRKEFMLAMGRKGFPEKDMNAALDRLARTLVRMENEITASGGPWLLGERITLADVAVMPAIVRMADLGLDAMWREKPAIARWYDAIRAHSAFEPTYYFGSLLSERFPHLKERVAVRA